MNHTIFSIRLKNSLCTYLTVTDSINTLSAQGPSAPPIRSQSPELDLSPLDYLPYIYSPATLTCWSISSISTWEHSCLTPLYLNAHLLATRIFGLKFPISSICCFITCKREKVQYAKCDCLQSSCKLFNWLSAVRPIHYQSTCSTIPLFLLLLICDRRPDLNWKMEPQHFQIDISRIAYVISILSWRAFRWAQTIWNLEGPLTCSIDDFLDHLKKVFGQTTFCARSTIKSYNHYTIFFKIS